MFSYNCKNVCIFTKLNKLILHLLQVFMFYKNNTESTCDLNDQSVYFTQLRKTSVFICPSLLKSFSKSLQRMCLMQVGE